MKYASTSEMNDVMTGSRDKGGNDGISHIMRTHDVFEGDFEDVEILPVGTGEIIYRNRYC
jgi:hypothetical protein